MFYDTKDAIFPAKRSNKKLLAFEYGAKVNIDNAYLAFGGGAANAAVNLSHLGFRTAVFAALGDDDNGKAIAENLEERGVDTRFLRHYPDFNSSFSFIITAGREKEHVIFVHRGAGTELQITKGVWQKFRSRWIYLTAMSGEYWRDNLDLIFSHVRVGKKYNQVAWNPGGEQLQTGFKVLKKYLEKTKFLGLNQSEAASLVQSFQKKTTLAKLKDIKFLLKTIRSFGPEMVLITAGRGGAYVYDGKRVYFQKVLSDINKIKDTTGVGDCFNSTFIAAYELSRDIKKSLYAAGLNSASVTTEIGAQNILLGRDKLGL